MRCLCIAIDRRSGRRGDVWRINEDNPGSFYHRQDGVGPSITPLSPRYRRLRVLDVDGRLNWGCWRVLSPVMKRIDKAYTRLLLVLLDNAKLF